MASTYVNDLRLNEMATGDASGSWGTVTNTNLELIGEAFSYGTETIGDADSTLTIADGAADAARSFYLKITSSVDLTTTRIVTLGPNTVSKVWMIENATTGSQVITIKQGSGATINVPNGQVKMISTDGAGSGGAVLDLLVDVDLTGTTTLVNLDVSGTLGVTGVLTATSLDISGDIDVDGTTNLDVVDIDGATQIDATVTVGVDDTGYDVKFFGATAGAYMLWDESADDLILGGAAGLSVNSTALVTGVLTTTAATVSNGGGQFNGAINVGVDDTGYDVKFFGATTGKSLLWDESADSLIVTGTTTLVGTTNLDAVDIDGATQIDATVTVGVDDTGYDVKFFGATAGKYMLWDESADTLEVSGTVVADGLTVSGAQNSKVAYFDDSSEVGYRQLQFTSSNNGQYWDINSQGTSGGLGGVLTLSTRSIDRMEINTGGDISFYAADGTTPSFVYDESAGLTINEAGADRDFRVESATNANALFVQGSDGFVGINTAVPGVELDITRITNSYPLRIGSTSASGRAMVFADISGVPAKRNWVMGAQYNTDDGWELTPSTAAGGYTFTNRVLTAYGSTGNLVVNEGGVDADFRVESDGSEYMLYVDGEQNSVGIKTNATDAALNVNSQNGSIDAIRIVGSGGNNFIAGYGNQGNLSFTLQEGEADDASTLILYRSGNAQHIIDADTDETVIFNEQGDNIDFRVESDGNANMLTVDASANSVLVGTSDTLTSRALFVKVNTYPQQNYATNASINYPTLQLRTAYATGVQTATQIDFRNGADASVGTIQSTVSSTSYNTSSDQRLKENIADADDAGSKIDAIQVRQFDWKIDGSHQDYGMVAQELQAVAPEAVSAPEDLDEMMSVDYSKLVPMMLKEIQSLRARVADLEL
jgi:hypothetical protein